MPLFEPFGEPCWWALLSTLEVPVRLLRLTLRPKSVTEERMTSPAETQTKVLLDRAFTEHRAGHFGRARDLLREIDGQADLSGLSLEDAARLADLRARFQPDWFAWFMLAASLLLFVFTIAKTWH